MEENTRKDAKAGSLRRKLQSRKLPLTIVEIAPEFILAASLRSLARPQLRRIGVTRLDSGIVEPSPLQLNVAEAQRLMDRLRETGKPMGARKGQVALLIPDAVARVSVLAFETLPAKKKDREALIRWRIKDTLGFAPEDASVSYQVTSDAPGSIEVLAVAVKTEILEQYETALKTFNAGIALTLPVTMALLPLLPGNGAGAQLLTHRGAGWVTNAVVTGERLRFWRSRSVASNGGTPEIVPEAARAAASVRDRLGIEISRAWYCARPPDESGYAGQIGHELGLPVEPLPLEDSIQAALGAEERELLSSFGAPVAGLIANRGEPR
ncbi:MAG: hypothetical protein ACRD3O_01895 [Terriglobia bacterium]